MPDPPESIEGKDFTVQYVSPIAQAQRAVEIDTWQQFVASLGVYFEAPETFDEQLGILKLKELIMIALKSENHNNVRQLLSEILAPVNTKFKQAVQQNLFNQLSLEELAFICNMSLSTFKREFKKHFNQTPAKYIKSKRLEKAASLLSCSTDPVGEIAFECGFQDITTFSANFQEKFNSSPSKYRLSQIRN